MRKRIYLVCAIALLFVVPVAMASDATLIILGSSPDSPFEAVEGETIPFNANILYRPLIQLTVEWFYDGVLLHSETIPTEGPVFWTTTAEVGTHQVKLVVTAYDGTNATNEWTVIVPEPTPISGTVTCADGSQVKGVTVTLYSGRGKNKVLVAETTTDINGDYTFSVSELGEYILLVDAPEGFRATPSKRNIEISGDVQAQSTNGDNEFVLKPMKGKKPKG